MIRSAPRIGALLVTIVLFPVQCLSAQAPPPPAPAATRASDLPAPPGDSDLGTFSEVWGDDSRPGGVDQGDADPREIRIQVWYPAARDASGSPAPYVPELDDLAPVFGDERTARYRSVRTHSLWRPEPDRERGPYPVVVFSHGKGMVRSFYTALLERLAARGRVVVAIDHPLGAEAVLLSGGRVVQLDLRWEEMEPPAVPIEQVFRFTEERSSLWVEDVRFVIDRLTELARPSTDWLLAGTLDLDRLAAIGHSLGGKAAALACKRDRRIRACADLDGWPLHRVVEAEGLNRPFLLLEDYRDVSAEELAGWGAERSEYVANMRALQRRKDDLFSRMPPESAHVMIRGIRHESFTDAPFLRPEHRDPAATLPPERALETIADYLGAFLVEHLEGRETEPFHPGAYVRIYGPRYEPSESLSPRRSSDPSSRLAAGSPTTAAEAEPPPAESVGPWAIDHVDVVPMDRPGVLRNRTVVVEDGVITEVGPADEVELAPDVEVVDGRGRWLLPGLVDTHVHLDDPDDLLLYLANGVTTIVNLRGSPEHLAWREELARGERPGPRMLTCGPFLRGPELEVEEIANRVREISRRGYDCVKIYDDWELEAYREVAAATREAEILFLGHAPREIGLEPVIEEGSQRIVHLEEVVYATPALNRWVEVFDEEAGPPETDPGVAFGEEVRRLAGRLAEAGIWVAATEVVIDTYLARSTPEGLERLAERPSWRYLDPFQRRRWARADEEDHRRFVHQVALQHLLLEAFREEGVPMALGTDASTRSDLLVMPGWSVHEELETLVEAGGFSPYQALRQATVDARRFLGRPGGGLVVEGAAADLLVLRENPLTDVHHVSDIETVVVRGERFSRAEFLARLDERRERWDPVEQALAEVEVTFEREGRVAGARAYLRLVERYPDYAEEVESLVNALGYELLFDDRIDEAIEVLRANAEAFPESANVWDSLAEAHLEKGDRDEAIRLYRRALDVDPDFSHAEEMLRELEGELGPE